MSVIDAIVRPKMAAEGLRPTDGVADMTHISDIDVTGINTNLRVRYNRDEIYTYTGTILVAVNPYKFLPVYENELMSKYHGKKMGEAPPHVFATAEAAFLNIQHSAINQSCVISGESGAGKTETTKFILQYLCAVTSNVTQWVEQQILEANVILEAFGNAKTVRNDNSSRFGKFMQVCFDDECHIRGSIIQEYLLEQSRITSQAQGERNYHIFYQLVKGADPKRFLLDPIQSYEYLNKSNCYTLDEVDDSRSFEELKKAMIVLNIDDETMDGIFSLVSAVLHIGNLNFKDIDGESIALTDSDKKIIAKVAQLLGVKDSQIAEVVTTRQIVVRGQSTTIPFKFSDAVENKHAMAKALYSRTFTWLVDQINSTTNPGANTQKFIGVLDIFGFENFVVNSFEQLCINFTNEKLHKFFNHYVFALEQAEYEREEINFSHIRFTDNAVCLELIEKPPACVLRLLDEECRFPKGTDESYLEKQHAALGAHVCYIKGADKTKWAEEFGIKHFAGDVTYRIFGFLDKNKDVMQDQLFEYMRDSKDPFVRSVTKFQNMLQMDRKVVMGSKLRRTKSIVSEASDNMRTNKAKPTIGDTFRRQLAALVEVLEDTTPWYVRCIKPNTLKKPRNYDDSLVVSQLQYSGMLDIVRIRKEGFPVHVPAEKFVEKYHAMAKVMGKPLSTDAKEATRQILTYIKAPTTEWQIGKTKVFLRNSIFEPLEDNLRKLLNLRVIMIQRNVRMWLARKKYLKMRAAIVLIQSSVRAAAMRWKYLRMRRAIIKIQAVTRGWRDREYVKEIRRKRKEELERKKREEADRKAREAREAGEALMEESFIQAQKELVAMAKMAEFKAEHAGTKPSQDLDSMFTFLGDASSKTTKEEEQYLKQVNNELDAIFQDQVPGGNISRTMGKRTMRRKKRVEKKILMEQEQLEAMKQEEQVNPREYSMFKFADLYFNDHPKGSAGTVKGSGKSDEPMEKTLMITHCKAPTIPTSMVHMHNPENVNLACSIWKDINKQISGTLKKELILQSTQSIIEYCLERQELRDEVYAQVIRQVTNNPRPEDAFRGWQFFAVCCVSFPPSKMMYKYVQAYILTSMADSYIREVAAFCLDALKRTKLNGERRRSPSQIEIEAIKSLQPVICRFYFLDGKAKAVGVHPCSTADDVIRTLADRINLKDTDGWAIFESTPDAEHFIRRQEYIGDILAIWEAAHRESAQPSKYQTVSRKGSNISQALGGGEARFVFRKRLFKRPREIPSDPVEYSLVYAQAVHSVVRADEFPVNDKVALQLAGLQAQVLWGDADESKISRYDDVSAYLPWRVRHANSELTAEGWQREVFVAHREYGNGKTDLQAQVLYLTAVKQYPLYGGTFFDVNYKGFWSYPARIILSIHEDGFKFVNQRTKEVMAEYGWDQLKNVEVNSYEDIISLHMETQSADETPVFMFQTPRTEDIANLIASYSPQHRNWKQVGVAAVQRRNATQDDRARLLNDMRLARKALAQSDILLPPPAQSSGFLATTLRRKKSSMGESGEDWTKTYPDRYWSYSKTKLAQPLSRMSSEEGEEAAQRMFSSLLVYAGLATSGGYEQEADPEFVGLIQNVIGRCLEKEDICNEFYLQLIKQTTDQPDPNSRINMRNWQLFAMTLGVVVPRNKFIISYISAHLRNCSVNPETEEGKYAQFCQQCLTRTIENKNRKYPPSTQEIECVSKRRPIYARFHFMDGEYRALMFDAAATTAEVVSMIMERIGLNPNVDGFSLFEVFGSLERNMLAWEKVADAIFKWEKYAKSTHSQKELRLTFKKRLFTGPFALPPQPVEFDLVFYQAIDDVRNDRFPVTNEEAAYLAALRAQVELGDLNPKQPIGSQYNNIMDQYLPKHMRGMVQPEDIAIHHQKLKGLAKAECNSRYLKFVQAWALYGSTIFEVLQSYTSTLPKNLWLAVDEKGIHIMRRRAKEPLISYTYRNIVNYSPSLRNLMIVTESLTRGTKFVFNTSQASQIAHLIKDYTHIIIQRKQPGALPAPAQEQ